MYSYLSLSPTGELPRLLKLMISANRSSQIQAAIQIQDRSSGSLPIVKAWYQPISVIDLACVVCLVALNHIAGKTLMDSTPCLKEAFAW